MIHRLWNRLWLESFNRKLIFLVTVTAMAALLLSLAAIVGFQTVTYGNLLVRELETVADVLGANGRAALVFDAPGDAARILSSLQAKTHVAKACFFNSQGLRFADYSRDGDDVTFPSPNLSGKDSANFSWSHLSLLRKIHLDGDHIGTIYIVSDLDDFYGQLQASLITAALIFVASSLLALWLSARVLAVVSGPIRSLVETASRVSSSRDYSLRAVKQSEDELGRLTDAFNRMLEQIQSGDAEVQRTHDELHRRLEELHREQSELEKSQARARQLQEKLARSQRMESLGVLAGGVAHDLNNILGPMVAYPDLILGRMAENDPLRRKVSRLGDSARKAAAVIQDFLTLGRRGNYETEVLELNHVVASYLDSPGFLELRQRGSGVIVKQELEAELWPIRGSAPHLTQLVMNLSINAFEAMPKGGILRIKTCSEEVPEPIDGFEEIAAGRYVVLKVIDTGTGIKEDDLSHIFEPFYTRKKLGRSGSGLGLAVVYGVVKDLGGRIDVRSTPGAGTEFAVYLPPTREKLIIKEPGDERYEGHERILIVDDVPEQRELAMDLLGSLGYRTTVAANGPEALELLTTRGFDLIVLDMILEDGFDGLETFQRAIKINPRQRCIIASGFSESERVKQAQVLGAGSYVAKPYTLRELGRAVRSELDRF